MDKRIRFELKRRLLNKSINIDDEDKLLRQSLIGEIKEYTKIQKQETFNQMIFKYLNKNKMSAPDLYNSSLVDRRTFSKLNNNDYKPNKNTAICLCLGLHLSCIETSDMLNRLGYSLSKSNDFDIAISFFLEKQIYNIIDINCYLSDLNLELLGSGMKMEILSKNKTNN